MPRNHQIVRQWKLLCQLERAPHGINVAEFVGDDPAKERTLYRDLDALGQAGFPLYTEEYDGKKRWRLSETFRRERGIPLELNELMALRCARSALAVFTRTPLLEAFEKLIDKLDCYLTPEMKRFADELNEIFVGDRFGQPDYGDLNPLIETLSKARHEQCSVEIGYRSQNGTETKRIVDPYNIWIHRNVPYLVAWCQARNAIRTFSLWRVVSAIPTKHRFEIQSGYTFDDFVRDRFRIFADGHSHDVRIWFAPEAATYIRERTWHATQKIDEASNGAIILNLHVDGLNELASWVMSFGPRAKVLAPQELIDDVREQLQNAVSRYQEEK